MHTSCLLQAISTVYNLVETVFFALYTAIYYMPMKGRLDIILIPSIYVIFNLFLTSALSVWGVVERAVWGLAPSIAVCRIVEGDCPFGAGAFGMHACTALADCSTARSFV